MELQVASGVGEGRGKGLCLFDLFDQGQTLTLWFYYKGSGMVDGLGLVMD